jgi:hypothetical protein
MALRRQRSVCRGREPSYLIKLLRMVRHRCAQCRAMQSASVTKYSLYRESLSAAAKGHHAMESLPTGPTQSWFIVAAVGLSPMLVFFIAGVIGRVLRREWRERQPGGSSAGTVRHGHPAMGRVSIWAQWLIIAWCRRKSTTTGPCRRASWPARSALPSCALGRA